MTFAIIQSLNAELALWQERNIAPQIWWRDDDVIDVTPELKKLQEIMKEHNVPVMLAVIPALAKPELPSYLNQEKLFSAATHGFGHHNHADAGSKKTELTENTDGRTVNSVLEELAISREKMERLFGTASSQILVPPWNRISESVLQQLKLAGFQMLSTFTDKKLITPIKQINCHIDLMEWKPERRGKEFEIIVQELIECLKKRRLSETPENPIGILSHHLVHDRNAWNTTEKLMRLFSQQAEIKILSSKELIAGDNS